MEDIDKFQLGDAGVLFRVRLLEDGLPVDLQVCNDKHLIFKKPDGTTMVEEADFYTDGADGYIQYVAASGYLDQTGMWKFQGYAAFSSSSFHTNYENFLVLDNL